MANLARGWAIIKAGFYELCPLGSDNQRIHDGTERNYVPKLANRIVIALLTAALVMCAGVVSVSAFGFLSPAGGSLDPAAYVLPLPQAQGPADGLAGPDTDSRPDSVRIQQGISALDRSQLGTVSYTVQDIAGNQVAGEDADTARIPASSWKILTSLGVLAAYGPNHRFSTTVVSSDGGIVLVGGGDPFLTSGTGFDPGQATIEDLADKTSQALSGQGVSAVVLGYDDTLFAGVQWSGAWTPAYSADVAPISALSVDPDGDADSNTSLQAARTFRNLLVDRGISVTDIRAQQATPDAQILAEVESLPLSQVVHRVLEISDNFGAEVLFRHISVAAGLDGSFASAQSAQTNFLQSKGLWAPAMSVSDGSGLSLADKVTPSVLASAVRLAYEDPALADVLMGLPVAAVDGTLDYRFAAADTASARGVLRAKTGTHDYVRSMTGFAQTSSGSIVFFSFMLNDLTNHTAALRWLDQAGAVLTS